MAISTKYILVLVWIENKERRDKEAHEEGMCSLCDPITISLKGVEFVTRENRQITTVYYNRWINLL